MTHQILQATDLADVFAVPPLPRRWDPDRTIHFAAAERIVQHIRKGGIRKLLFGGNAFLYHVSLDEYEQLLDWLSGIGGDLVAIPSAGPSFGRARDQAVFLRKHRFPCVMMLPCNDPKDATGLEGGLREIADRAEMPLMLYLKSEENFGPDREKGLDAIWRLVEDGVCVVIKYAIVRPDPREDPYLSGLLERVSQRLVISGMGERPAIVHMKEYGLPGFTTGSGCIAPALSRRIHELCTQGRYKEAEVIRELFMPLEDLRDQWGPARVLHAAVRLAGIADTGPVLPFLSDLTRTQEEELKGVVEQLLQWAASLPSNVAGMTIV